MFPVVTPTRADALPYTRFAPPSGGYQRGMGDAGREQRHARRWVTRIGLGAAIGGSIGLVVGLIWGSIAFRVGSPAMWAVVASCAIFLGILGAFVGGMSGLESPDPGHEPSQVDEPLEEPRDLTGRERGSDASQT
jgi:hypothetical protein